MAIDYNSLPSETPSYNGTFAAGKYILTIEKAEMKQPSDANKPEYLNLTCAVTDIDTGNSVGKIWDTFFDIDKDLPRYKLKQFIDALGLKLAVFELKDLTKIIVGKQLKADISVDKKADPEKNQINVFAAGIYYPLETPEANPEEPTMDNIDLEKAAEVTEEKGKSNY